MSLSSRPTAPTPGMEVAQDAHLTSPVDTPRRSADGGAETPPALTAEHYAQLAAAQIAYGPIRRALRVVAFSAWTLALFAVLSLPFAFFSAKGAYAAACLIGTAVFEFRGRAALRRLDTRGVTILTRNQIVLTGLMSVYCLWSMATAWFGPDRYAQAVERYPELGELLAPYSDLFRQLTVAVYAIVLVVGWLVQALVIRYYATRRRHVEQYLAQTPEWILSWNAKRG
ncbi:MAG: hypothetical protein AAGJ38_03765 [Planctomycetota bacterium]